MTFSIVAHDPLTGALGVATATAGPMVGALVPHGASGFGIIATQALTNPYLAYDALDLLAGGSDAQQAMDKAVAGDPSPELRQFIIVDAAGNTAGWTGQSCQGVAGHLLGAGFAVAGNLVANDDVLPVMAAAFGNAHKLDPLSVRLLAAMEAGAIAGGDRRGVGSAAIKVFHRERFPLLDIRVDWSETAMADLRDLHEEAVSGDYAEFFALVPRRP
ncbi:DUF1028 domain-containing protein [Devosia sp. CAU 1758]